jgi:hypothetical protein
MFKDPGLFVVLMDVVEIRLSDLLWRKAEE